MVMEAAIIRKTLEQVEQAPQLSNAEEIALRKEMTKILAADF
jgi:hypothetical protein